MKKLATILALVLVLSCFTAMADPIVEEKVTFSWLIDDNYTVEDHAPLYEMLEEQTNVHVDLILYPNQTALEKMSVALSTGNYPDVIGGWLLGTKDILDLGVGQGTFLPLEDLIEEYCPNISAVLEIPGVRDSMTCPDGHIYSIPYVVAEPEATYKPYINQIWLEKLDLDMPTTPAELKEVLIAFRDNDVNGNGDPNDEIGFSGDPVNLNLGMLAGWFGIDGSGVGDYPFFTLVDGKLVFSANTDEYRAFLEYFADLWSEGLVDPEIFTQDLATWKSKGQQDLYGVSIAYGPGEYIDDYDRNTEADLYEKYGPNRCCALPVLAGCENPTYHRNSYGVTLFRTQMVITDKCDEEKAAIILQWFDNLYEEENSVQTQWGKIGVCIEKLGEGLYRNLDMSGWTEEQKTANGWGRLFTQSSPRWYHDAQLLGFGKDEVEKSFMEVCDELYAPYLGETFKKVWVTDEEDIARSSILTTDINKYCKEMIAKFVSGEVVLTDESWAAYCEQLNTYGLDELYDINCRILGIEE